MVEDEASLFSGHFSDNDIFSHSSVHEVVLPLHDEALRQLDAIALLNGIDGSNEHKRSIALHIALNQFKTFSDKAESEIFQNLRLSAGSIKPRPICIFAESLSEIGKLEQELHCSEVILLETAIRSAAAAAAATSGFHSRIVTPIIPIPSSTRA